MSTRAAYLGQSDICSLGERVKELSIEVYGARKNEGVGQRSEFELMDILDELRAELVGPMRWPGTSLAPPDMAAIQVAFQRRFFQLVPRSREQAGELIDVESPTGDGGQRMMCLEHPSITAGTLAKKARMSEDQVVRIMRVLTTNLIFTESDEKVFAHTSISAGLANDLVAGRVGGIFNDLLKACSGLNDAIEHGQKSAWHERFGMSLYEHLETRSPADREGLAKSMTVTSIAEAEEVSKGFPWHRFKKVADVGGSFGRFVAGICKVSNRRRLLGIASGTYALGIRAIPTYLASFKTSLRSSRTRKGVLSNFRQKINSRSSASSLKGTTTMPPNLELTVMRSFCDAAYTTTPTKTRCASCRLQSPAS